jgi:hypothetical protein
VRPCCLWLDADYAEAGADYHDRRDARNRDHLVRHYQHALTRLGYQVTLTPPGDSHQSPGATTTPIITPGQVA